MITPHVPVENGSLPTRKRKKLHARDGKRDREGRSLVTIKASPHSREARSGGGKEKALVS